MAGLDRFARTPLGHWPTPLEPLERLSKHLGGPEIFVKRDDCSGLALGGNKVRKLEYLLAHALAIGAERIITVGGIQSNHARQTAAASAQLGLGCDLVLSRMVEREDLVYERAGNVLLDRLLGAQVHLVADTTAAVARVEELREKSRARGETTFVIPPGGSSAIGCLGYVRAAQELIQQTRSAGLSFDRVFLAVSTGGTHAGLRVGLHELQSSAVVDGICVYADADSTRERIRKLSRECAALLAASVPAEDGIQVSDDQLGAGYGVSTEPMREALRLSAELEGLLLDPVYTGKAMAGLIESVRDGPVRSSERVLFWHTGGTPALFAHPEVLEDRTRPGPAV